MPFKSAVNMLTHRYTHTHISRTEPQHTKALSARVKTAAQEHRAIAAAVEWLKKANDISTTVGIYRMRTQAPISNAFGITDL